MGYHPIAIPDLPSPSDIPLVQQRLDSLITLRKEASAALELSQARMLRHSTKNFAPFQVGDKVWLEATHLNVPNQSRKLAPKREGPSPSPTNSPTLSTNYNSQNNGAYTLSSTPPSYHPLPQPPSMDPLSLNPRRTL